jgi:excinuclease UvrABC ATPase subunit
MNNSKEYYLNNKEKWKTYVKYVTCDLCQKEIKKDHFNSSHLKTKKHQALMQQKLQKEREIVEKEQELQELKTRLRAEILNEIGQKIFELK